MSSESVKLTANDPVDPATLKRLSGLAEVRQQIALQLLECEQERVRLLLAARPVEQEQQGIFEKVLQDRGLPPNTPMEVDAKTGQLTLHIPQPDKA